MVFCCLEILCRWLWKTLYYIHYNEFYALTFQQTAAKDFAIIVSAGKWHNIINTGEEPLKLYSIYAPVEHPHGAVHKTFEEAEAAEHEHF